VVRCGSGLVGGGLSENDACPLPRRRVGNGTGLKLGRQGEADGLMGGSERGQFVGKESSPQS
jgi:hypothetical protein